MKVGELSSGAIADVDERGTVHRDGVTLRWRVWARDRWLDPATDVSVRHARPSAAPVAHTSLRVPGGDAIQRVYAAGDGTVMIEVENDSPEALAVAFAVDGADARAVLAIPREPGDVEPDGALVFPIPHRVLLRVALGHPEVDVRTVPDVAAVTRGWDRVLERGMRTELPEPWQHDIDAARADALLAPPSAEAFVALEDWGFDDEAAAMWMHLDGRARRAARKRRVETGTLTTMRAALVHVDGREISFAPGFDPAWLGASIAVHDAPLRAGRASFAIRWHGSRPALLWEAPEGCVVRAPALDPEWSSTEPAGETLLREPQPSLLLMGKTDRDGVTLAAPETFS